MIFHQIHNLNPNLNRNQAMKTRSQSILSFGLISLTARFSGVYGTRANRRTVSTVSSRSRAFTLVELLLVLVILGILAAMVEVNRPKNRPR